MVQTGSFARQINIIKIADIQDSQLKMLALNMGAYIEVGNALVSFDTGWQVVEGFVCSEKGYIADPINSNILELPYDGLTQLFNKYARGDYDGAP